MWVGVRAFGCKNPQAMTTSFAAIVVAAGAGTRFGADRPKALLQLGDRPLVRHAADAMINAGCAELVVVIPDGWRQAFESALTGCRPS